MNLAAYLFLKFNLEHFKKFNEIIGIFRDFIRFLLVSTKIIRYFWLISVEAGRLNMLTYLMFIEKISENFIFKV